MEGGVKSKSQGEMLAIAPILFSLIAKLHVQSQGERSKTFQ